MTLSRPRALRDSDSLGDAVAARELSSSLPSRSLAANAALWSRLAVTRKLPMHRGCVNTVEWSDDASLLVSVRCSPRGCSAGR